MRAVHRMRQAPLAALTPFPLAACSRASPACCIATPSHQFHSSATAYLAAPAAASKPAGKPGAAAAGAAGPSALLTPPTPGSKRWVQEGWNAPRLVPIVNPAQKTNAEGLLVQKNDAAIDAAEMAEAHVIPVLHAEVREQSGSKFSRHLRQQRMRIPGIICDRAAPRQNQLLITLDRFELEALARKFRRTMTHKVCLIEIEGQEPIKVIADELTRHPVTQELQVANWFLFKPNQEKVKIKMPIVYTGTEECIGVKRGGVIVILRDSVPCVWSGDEHIPSFLHIDMANTDGGKVFRNADLRLAPGLRLANPAFDYIVATVLGVKSKGGNEDEEVVDAAAAAPTAHQPSAIQLEKEKKEKERREEEEMVAQKLAQKAAKTGKK
jgi:large subunit ribosomal protein L25